LLDDGSGPERNWLVEHLDGHDVLTIRKCKWAVPRSASELAEVEESVADFWARSAHGSGSKEGGRVGLCREVEAKGVAALLDGCRAAQDEDPASVAARRVKERSQQH
jgi:hypothetical protein